MLETRKAIYGLPQAGILANKLLREKLAKHGYYEVNHTPGLWQHVARPVQFSLVVKDDFGVKYVGEENAQHLINTIQTEGYKLSIDWYGSKYCGIMLQWDYDMRTLTISMPRYVQKMLVDSSMNHHLKISAHHTSRSQRSIANMRMTQFLPIIHRYWMKNARRWCNR